MLFLIKHLFDHNKISYIELPTTELIKLKFETELIKL